MITNVFIFISGVTIALFGVHDKNTQITMIGCTMIISSVLFHIADKIKEFK